MPDTGNGATITFGTTGFTASYRRIGGTEQAGEAIEDSHLGTTTRKTYIPGDLFEPGQFDAEFLWNPTVSPPTPNGAAETITITYPKQNSGSAAAATLAGTGFVISRTFPEFQNNTINMGNFTVKWDGKTGPTYTVEA